MCRSARHEQQYLLPAAQFQFGGHSTPVETDHSRGPIGVREHPAIGRSSSFTVADVDDNASLSSLLSSRGIGPVVSSLARASLRAKAEEIVNRLDREEPLLSESSTSSMPQKYQIPSHSFPTHPVGPMSLPSDPTPYHTQMGGSQNMLSPIAEQPGTEDVSPSSTVPPLSHHGSQPQFLSLGSGFSSYEMDGPGHTSMGGGDAMSVPPQSLKLGAEKAQVPECPMFPKQTLLHRLNSVSGVCVCVCVWCCVVFVA